MSERPWYKRYPSDFIAGALGLTLEEKGAYSIVLDLIYDRGRPIADDARYIAGVCGCSVRRWKAIRKRLIETGKIVAADGVISNSRAEKMLEKSQTTARKLSETNRKNAQKRWRPPKNQQDSDANRTLRARDQKLEASTSSLRSDVLTQLETVLEPERAKAVIEHRQRIRKPLTAYAAKLLAQKLAKCPEPAAAADAMIANGWQGFEPEWLENRKPRPNGHSPPVTGFAAVVLENTPNPDHGPDQSTPPEQPDHDGPTLDLASGRR